MTGADFLKKDGKAEVADAGVSLKACSGSNRSHFQQPRSINWRAPTVMFGALMTGCLSAIAHHVVYSYYNGRLVHDVKEQRYLSNAGTAFAFLVKMFLAIATGSAYVQHFWVTVRSKPFRLGRIDRMNSVLKDLTVLLDLKLWFGNPVLSMLAIITWWVYSKVASGNIQCLAYELS